MRKIRNIILCVTLMSVVVVLGLAFSYAEMLFKQEFIFDNKTNEGLVVRTTLGDWVKNCTAQDISQLNPKDFEAITLVTPEEGEERLDKDLYDMYYYFSAMSFCLDRLSYPYIITDNYVDVSVLQQPFTRDSEALESEFYEGSNFKKVARATGIVTMGTHTIPKNRRRKIKKGIYDNSDYSFKTSGYTWGSIFDESIYERYFNDFESIQAMFGYIFKDYEIYDERGSIVLRKEDVSEDISFKNFRGIRKDANGSDSGLIDTTESLYFDSAYPELGISYYLEVYPEDVVPRYKYTRVYKLKNTSNTTIYLEMEPSFLVDPIEYVELSTVDKYKQLTKDEYLDLFKWYYMNYNKEERKDGEVVFNVMDTRWFEEMEWYGQTWDAVLSFHNDRAQQKKFIKLIPQLRTRRNFSNAVSKIVDDYSEKDERRRMYWHIRELLFYIHEYKIDSYDAYEVVDRFPQSPPLGGNSFPVPLPIQPEEELWVAVLNYDSEELHNKEYDEVFKEIVQKFNVYKGEEKQIILTDTELTLEDFEEGNDGVIYLNVSDM